MTHTAKTIMIQGTTSNAGKSFLTAALCRIFRQDGYRAAPFKSQNMALNSYITKSGLEMGRAQVMQAEAAGIEPAVEMNPILLKPTSHTGSQVIVNGEVMGTTPTTGIPVFSSIILRPGRRISTSPRNLLTIRPLMRRCSSSSKSFTVP